MIVAYIDEHKTEHGIEPICEMLQFAPSTYYAAKTRPLSKRAIRDAVLKVAIVTVHQANYEVYGVRKMWKAMRRGRKVRTTRADEKANRFLEAHRRLAGRDEHAHRHGPRQLGDGPLGAWHPPRRSPSP